MVVTSCPAARETEATHDRTACPSIWTVHAPHCAIPHPYFVPVSPRLSRTTHNRGVEGSTSRSTGLPLILKEIMNWFPLKVRCCNAERFGLTSRKNYRFNHTIPAVAGNARSRGCQEDARFDRTATGFFAADLRGLDADKSKT